MHPFLSGICFRNSTGEWNMKSIAIVGSNVLGLLSADILSEYHNITIIDSGLELGFPSSFPGCSNDKEIIRKILINQDGANLFLKNNNGIVNFRTEWFCKLLTHKLAKKGVTIHNRTTVVDYNESLDAVIIITSGSDVEDKQLQFDLVIDFSNISYTSIGTVNHTLAYGSNMIIRPEITVKEYFVGICLDSDAKILENYELYLDRGDGLVEIWYNKEQQITPSKGWLESKIVSAYHDDSKLMFLDDYYHKAIEIVGMVDGL